MKHKVHSLYTGTILSPEDQEADSNISNNNKLLLKKSLSTETMLSTEHKNSVINMSLDETLKPLYPSTGNNLIYDTNINPNNLYKIPNLSTEITPAQGQCSTQSKIVQLPKNYSVITMIPPQIICIKPQISVQRYFQHREDFQK